jgi:cysteinyl-tRNA synthetase
MAAWTPGTEERSEAATALDERFRAAVADDLDLPRALVVLNETVGSAVPDAEKYGLLASWDRILGLDLERDAREGWEPTEEVLALVVERDAARAAKDFATSDAIRERLQAMGLEVMDSAEGTRVRPKV